MVGAVALVVLAVLCAAALAATASRQTDRQRAAGPPQGHHHATTSPASAPTGLEALAAHAQHEAEEEQQGQGPSRADDTRAYAQGLRRAKAGTRCAGAVYELPSPAGPRCTHGDDHDLIGVAPLLGESGVAGTSRSSASLACIGDGTSGNRIQLMYVRRSNQIDRFGTMKPKMIDWAATIDEIMVRSAEETGGVRRVRWATDDSCRPTVLNVVVPNSVDTFAAMVDALVAKGYTPSNRKYLVAAEMGNYCGLGESVPDERPDAANYNNGSSLVRAMFASVSAVQNCWVDTIAAHEVMHTLGAVQRGAPNATQYGHCTDDADIMCYQDGPATPPMRQVCPPSHENLYDCNHDDYFSTNPAVGTYLRNNWNTANNAFLDATGSRSTPFAPVQVTAVPGTTSATVSWSPPAYNGGSPLLGYVVTASPSGVTASTGPGASSVVVNGLADGVATTFTVQAENNLGLSPVSAASDHVTPTPTISTVATFPSGYPWGVTAGPAGSAYVTDRGSSTVVKVAADGTKTTVAGGGLPPTNPPIEPAPATAQAIDAADVAVSPITGDLYVSDQLTNRIRKVSSGLITSVTTVSGLIPGALAFAPDGTLYVIDEGHQRVRRVDSATSVPTVAGTGTVGFGGDGGPGTSAKLDDPSSLATDDSGNLYIADYGNNRVRKLTPGGTISTFAGDGGASIDPDGMSATSTSMPFVRGLAWNDGVLFAQTAGAIRAVGTSGKVSTWVGEINDYGDSGDGGPSSLARFEYVSDLAVSSDRLLLVDQNRAKLRRVEAPTVPIPTVPGAPLGLTATASPTGAFLDWVPPANGGSPILEYDLTISPGGLTRVVAGDKTYAVIYGLVPGETYTYDVHAVNAVGAGDDATAGPLLAPAGGAWAPFSSMSSFIRRQYLDFIGRSPTSTELATTPSSEADLILRLMRGKTFGDTYGPVARLYFAYFLRAPDQSGLDYWRGKLAVGTSLTTVSQSFASSGEFRTRYGSLSNHDFVTTVYQNVLGRSGDPGGVSYWTSQLDLGRKTRGAVMIGFSESSEYKRVRGPEIDTILLYRGLLDRVPTKTEFPLTVARVRGGLPLATLIGELLNDPAYKLRAGLSV
jgi:hypothetical protein